LHPSFFVSVISPLSFNQTETFNGVLVPARATLTPSSHRRQITEIVRVGLIIINFSVLHLPTILCLPLVYMIVQL
jgi:hypothetical protein